MDKNNDAKFIVRWILLFSIQLFLTLLLFVLLAGGSCKIFYILNLRIFDFVCGHNIYLLYPFLLIFCFIIFFFIPPFKQLWKQK